jgi:hypothetical protein
MTTMEWKSDFTESFVDQGHVEAKREDVLKALDLRDLRPTEEQRARVASSSDLAQLDQWFARSLNATSAAEVFAG